MDQIDPYNVLELSKGVPRPENIPQNSKSAIKYWVTLPEMEKRNFLKSARTKTVDSIDSIDCIDSIGSEDSTVSIDSIEIIDIDSIDSLESIYKDSI